MVMKTPGPYEYVDNLFQQVLFLSHRYTRITSKNAEDGLQISYQFFRGDY